MGELRRRAARLVIPVLAVGIVAALLLLPLPDPWSRGWRGSILDLGHVPLFAALTLAWVRRDRSPLPPALCAAGLAGVAELVQAGVGRNPDWGDFLRGVLGALAAAAGVAAWRARRTPRRAAGFVLVVAGLLAWPLLDIGPRLLDAARGYRDFPVLADFRTDSELVRWEPAQAVLTRTADPDRPDGWVGRLELQPGPEPYPGASLEPITGDFRGYRRLCCSFGVEGGPLEVVISVRSGAGEGRPTTHYQTGRVYGSGPHTVRLELPEVAPRARPRPLDLSDVRAVQFFTTDLTQPRTMLIRAVWLER